VEMIFDALVVGSVEVIMVAVLVGSVEVVLAIVVNINVSSKYIHYTHRQMLLSVSIPDASFCSE